MMAKTNLLACALLFAGAAGTAQAAPDTADLVAQGKRVTALETARMLNDGAFRQALSDAFGKATPRSAAHAVAVPLRPVLTGLASKADTSASRVAVGDAEMRALRAKGTAGNSQGLFEIRLQVPAGQAQPTRLDTLSVAFAPAGDESTWTTIEAFDASGKVHTLDAHAPLAEPMLVVDVDGREDMRSGIEVVNRMLAEHGLQPGDVTRAVPSGTGNELTTLNKIILKADEEPWIAGDAEIYAIESGINTDGTRPLVVIHDMPWLDQENTVYTPGQHLISWKNHSAIGFANLQLMEQDDNTDWAEKGAMLLKAVGTVVGPIQPEVAVVAAIGAAILTVLPDGTLTNDDDYVDSFYLLEQGKTYVDLDGARNNATATFGPR